MDIRAAIELLLDRINTRRQFVGGTFAAFGGTAGNILLLQKDLNAAILLWQERRVSNGLKQLAATLQAYGNLTDDEYEQIMEALGGEK